MAERAVVRVVGPWTQAEPIVTAVGLAVWGWTPPGGGSTIVDIDPAYVDPTD